jgi:AraC-like DNA-binding protein
MVRIDTAAHEKRTHAERQYLFLKLLLTLKEKPTVNPTARQLSDYIEKNLARISSLSDVCEAFHYSKNYIIRIFNKEFGLSPIQYINDVRIKRAMYLLETTSRSVKEIMEECGYSDYPYFYKRFVRRTGLSPLRWRCQIQQNPLIR